MQEQAQILAIAALAKAALAGLVGGEMQLGRVLNRQHVPPGHALAGLTADGRQHLRRRHRWVGQEAAELDRLVAVLRQPMDAQRPPAVLRFQQGLAHMRQSLVPKPPKACLDHANHTLMPSRGGYRFRGWARWQVVPYLCDSRSPQGEGEKISRRATVSLVTPASPSPRKASDSPPPHRTTSAPN